MNLSKIRILYINVIEQNANWGAETFVNRGFLSLGHQTFNLDFRKNRNKLSSIIKKNNKFDVLFLQRGDRFPLFLLKTCNRPKFFWATELVSRNRDQDRLLKSNIFDHVFVHSNDCRKKILENNWISKDKVSVMINGFDSALHRKMNVKKDIDLLFVGSLLPRREKIFKKLKKHFNLEVRAAFGDEMVSLFNRSKIVLNIHAEDHLDTETRVFEALGCGAFLISERLSSENPFIPDQHYVEVSDTDTMIKKISYYLNNDTARNSIAENGFHEAINNHTYTNRAEQFVDIFNNYKYSQKKPSYNSVSLSLFMFYEFCKRNIKLFFLK